MDKMERSSPLMGVNWSDPYAVEPGEGTPGFMPASALRHSPSLKLRTLTSGNPGAC